MSAYNNERMIETERLLLRLMREDDLHHMFKVFSDKHVLAAFDLSTFSEGQMHTWVNRNLKHQNEYGYGLFSVVLKSNGQFIGDCGLEHGEFEGRPCVEIGYDLISDYWNQGYATEAASAVRDFALTKLELREDSLCSFIRVSNKASQRVSEKIGMFRIKSFINNGNDYYLYAFSGDFS